MVDLSLGLLHIDTMAYARLTQKASAPQFLQVSARGQLYDIMLHRGIRETNMVKGGSYGYGREQRRTGYGLWLFTGGTGRFSLKRRLHPFRRGTLLLTGPGEPHPVVQACDTPTSILGIAFSMMSRTGDALLIPVHELLSLLSGERLSRVGFPQTINAKLTRQMEWLMEEYIGDDFT